MKRERALGQPWRLEEGAVVDRRADAAGCVLEPAANELGALDQRHELGKLPLGDLAQTVRRGSVV